MSQNSNSKREDSRMSNTDQLRRSNGRWNAQEHEKFLMGLQLYGKDWKKIEAFVSTRTGAQIRSHAQKFFIKLKKDDTEQPEEEETSRESPEATTLSLAKDIEDESHEHSYFLSIMYLYHLPRVNCNLLEQPTFDFWESLVDHKQVRSDTPPAPKRKSSFVSIWEELGPQELTKRIKV